MLGAALDLLRRIRAKTDLIPGVPAEDATAKVYKSWPWQLITLSSGSTGYSTYTELVASTAADYLLTGVPVWIDDGDQPFGEFSVKVAVGAAGSEADVAEFSTKIGAGGSANATMINFLMSRPYKIVSGSRVSIAVKKHQSASGSVEVRTTANYREA